MTSNWLLFLHALSNIWSRQEVSQDIYWSKTVVFYLDNLWFWWYVVWKSDTSSQYFPVWPSTQSLSSCIYYQLDELKFMWTSKAFHKAPFSNKGLFLLYAISLWNQILEPVCKFVWFRRWFWWCAVWKSDILL